MAFAAWLSGVDSILMAKVGLTHDDLPDGPSYDSWSGGSSQADYARQLLAEAGYTEVEDD